ncbi:type IV pilin protein [Anaerorhabdus sp.]|nr:prepilin-type N-terminal cleavage/methylation domain-containing protein [Anaerorhabdus sp.]MEA4874115.1 prepilin-type N-terminal cleavage/methylation domain-containing protein [Anaerorhabdus sp.]
MKHNITKKAFTLIELIVVIAVLAVLAVLIVPQVTGYI